MDNNKCISKCYKGMDNKIHPLYLINISSKKPFCLTNPNKLHDECKYNSDEVDNDNIDYFIPRLNISKSYVLNNIYNIYNWNDLMNFFLKNKKIVKITADRLLCYSWDTLYETFKYDIDDVINVYNVYLKLFYKSKKVNISDIIFLIKKKNVKKELIHNTIERYILGN